MIIKGYYNKLQGSHYEIGKQIGKAIGDKAELLRQYVSEESCLDDAVLQEVISLLNQYCPNINEEIQGFCDELKIQKGQVKYYQESYIYTGCSHGMIPYNRTKDQCTYIECRYVDRVNFVLAILKTRVNMTSHYTHTLESGSDEVLKRVNKGHTIQEAKEQLKRLDKANIDHIASLMLGVAGKGKGIENAKTTARFLNETKPKIIWLGTLGVVPGTELFEEVQKGKFEEASEIENLMEEKVLLESIQLHNVPFYGVHITNSVPILGVLPKDKERLISTLDNAIDNFDEEEFKKTFNRLERGR